MLNKNNDEKTVNAKASPLRASFNYFEQFLGTNKSNEMKGLGSPFWPRGTRAIDKKRRDEKKFLIFCPDKNSVFYRVE